MIFTSRTSGIGAFIFRKMIARIAKSKTSKIKKLSKQVNKISRKRSKNDMNLF